MASKRFVTRLTSTPVKASIRPFSSTPWQRRSPALSDVEPDNAEAFDRKQQQFRQELSEKVKQQKHKERTAAPKTTAESTSPSSSSSPSAMNSHGELQGAGLGSLSTVTGEAQREQDEANNKKKPGSGRLSSLIYGTEEGREMDREIERSFSQVLARGKYVHSIVFHEVKPDKVDEYVELVGSWYPRMASMPENKVHLVGSWRTEVGDCDTFGETSQPSFRVMIGVLTMCSPHLGVPALRGLPRQSPCDPAPPRVSRI